MGFQSQPACSTEAALPTWQCRLPPRFTCHVCMYRGSFHGRHGPWPSRALSRWKQGRIYLSTCANKKRRTVCRTCPGIKRGLGHAHVYTRTHTGKTCGTLAKSRALGGPCSLTARPTTPGRCAPWVAGTMGSTALHVPAISHASR